MRGVLSMTYDGTDQSAVIIRGAGKIIGCLIAQSCGRGRWNEAITSSYDRPRKIVPPTFNLRVSETRKNTLVNNPSPKRWSVVTEVFVRGVFVDYHGLFRCFLSTEKMGCDSDFRRNQRSFRSYLYETGFEQCCFHSCRESNCSRRYFSLVWIFFWDAPYLRMIRMFCSY